MGIEKSMDQHNSCPQPAFQTGNNQHKDKYPVPFWLEQKQEGFIQTKLCNQ